MMFGFSIGEVWFVYAGDQVSIVGEMRVRTRAEGKAVSRAIIGLAIGHGRNSAKPDDVARNLDTPFRPNIIITDPLNSPALPRAKRVDIQQAVAHND